MTIEASTVRTQGTRCPTPNSRVAFFPVPAWAGALSPPSAAEPRGAAALPAGCAQPRPPPPPPRRPSSTAPSPALLLQISCAPLPVAAAQPGTARPSTRGPAAAPHPLQEPHTTYAQASSRPCRPARACLARRQGPRPSAAAAAALLPPPISRAGRARRLHMGPARTTTGRPSRHEQSTALAGPVCNQPPCALKQRCL